jgi:hypothetical protein
MPGSDPVARFPHDVRHASCLQLYLQDPKLYNKDGGVVSPAQLLIHPVTVCSGTSSGAG